MPRPPLDGSAFVARRDPSLWLEALANVVLATVLTWTIIWFGSASIGIERGSWFAILHPGVFGMFAIIGLPVGLFWTLFGIPLRRTGILKMRPLRAWLELRELIREGRAASRERG